MAKGGNQIMYVTHNLRLDLTRPELTERIALVQDDRYSRNLSIRLFENGRPFCPDSSCTLLIRYQKPDGIGGAYDALPDGTPGWDICENRLTVRLAPQVCTVPGITVLTVTLLRGSSALTVFAVELDVRPLPVGRMESREYVSIATPALPLWDTSDYGKFLSCGPDGLLWANPGDHFPDGEGVAF